MSIRAWDKKAIAAANRRSTFAHRWREVDSWGGCYCYCEKCDLVVTGTSDASVCPIFGCSAPAPVRQPHEVAPSAAPSIRSKPSWVSFLRRLPGAFAAAYRVFKADRPSEVAPAAPPDGRGSEVA